MQERQARAETSRAVRTIPMAEPARSVGTAAASCDAFVGEVALTRRLREQLCSAAALRCHVLITGELGAGRGAAHGAVRDPLSERKRTQHRQC